MTADLLPFALEETPLEAPVGGVTAGGSRPVWSDYRPKTPVDCNHCEQVAFDTARSGAPFPGLRTARRKRRQGGVSLLLCHEHARIQREKDDAEFAEAEGLW